MAKERLRLPPSVRVAMVFGGLALISAAGWGIIEAGRDGEDGRPANSPDVGRLVEPTFSPADTLLVGKFTPLPTEVSTATPQASVETLAPRVTPAPDIGTIYPTLIPAWTPWPTPLPTSPPTPEVTPVPPTPEPITIQEGLNYEWANSLVGQINKFRTKPENGLNSLVVDPNLTRSAEKYAKLLFNTPSAEWGHYLSGTSPSSRAQNEGYNGVAGEVLGSSDPITSNPKTFFEEAWVNSAEHKAVILTAGAQNIGGGCYQGFYSGATNLVVCIVDFGIRFGSTPTPSVKP